MELWREIVGTERDNDPCGRFTYVAEKLIHEDRFRERALQVMREIRSRCVEEDGKHRYDFERRGRGIDVRALADVRHHLDAVGEFTAASMEELVPRPSWMSDDQWARAFGRYVGTMTLEDRATNAFRDRLGIMFGGVPMPDREEFVLPARGVLTGHLVHAPLMGDLAELLATVGAIAAANYQDAFYRASDYVLAAARTPPLIVAKEGGGFHLVHVFRD